MKQSIKRLKNSIFALDLLMMIAFILIFSLFFIVIIISRQLIDRQTAYLNNAKASQQITTPKKFTNQQLPNQADLENIINQNFITIIDPNGSEIWQQDEKVIIRWNQTSVSDTTSLFICYDEVDSDNRYKGHIYQRIVSFDKDYLPENTTIGDHQYLWQVPDIKQLISSKAKYGLKAYRILAHAYVDKDDGDYFLYDDFSDDFFTINSADCQETIISSSKYVRCGSFYKPSQCVLCPDNIKKQCQVSSQGDYKVGFNCPNGQYHYSFCSANPDGTINFSSCLEKMKPQCGCK